MHRKSAYFLVSGRARPARHRHRHAFQHERVCARQSRRRLFFHQTPGRSGSESVSPFASPPRWSITISGNAPGGFGSRSRSSPSRFVLFRISACASTARAAGSDSVRSLFNRPKSRRSPRFSFWPFGFRVTKRPAIILSTALPFRSLIVGRCSRLFSPRWTSERPFCSARPHLW